MAWCQSLESDGLMSNNRNRDKEVGHICETEKKSKKPAEEAVSLNKNSKVPIFIDD